MQKTIWRYIVFRIGPVLHEIQQHVFLILFVLEAAVPGVEFQVETQVAVHQFQRIVNGRDDTVYLAVRVCPGVHLEHLPESGIGVGTGAMTCLLYTSRCV